MSGIMKGRVTRIYQRMSQDSKSDDCIAFANRREVAGPFGSKHETPDF